MSFSALLHSVSYSGSWGQAHLSLDQFVDKIHGLDTQSIVAVGYADGILRSGGAARGKPAAEVIVAGKRCPLAGRVSMDLLAVDVTDLAPGAVRRGDLATLIGDGLSVDDLAAGMGTIGYEVLTHLGRRYHRLYKGE